MSLLIDKYKPKNFNEFIINKKIANKILKLIDRECFLNIIFYGIKGTGKYTLAMCLLNEYFGTDIYNKKNTIYKVKIGNNIKEISVVHSNYHFEIFVNNYLFNDKITIVNLLNQIIDNLNIQTNTYNIILIKNIDNISKANLKYFSTVLQRYSNTCRFIFISNNISKLQEIVYYLIPIRVPKAEKEEIYEFLEYNNINIQNLENLNGDFINNKSYFYNIYNLNYLFSMIEMSNLNKKYKIQKLIELEKFIKILEKKKIECILELRNQIYNYCSFNYDKNDIFRFIIEYYLDPKSNINNIQKQKIIEKSAEFQHLMCESYREIIHLEAYLVNVLNILIQD